MGPREHKPDALQGLKLRSLLSTKVVSPIFFSFEIVRFFFILELDECFNSAFCLDRMRWLLHHDFEDENMTEKNLNAIAITPSTPQETRQITTTILEEHPTPAVMGAEAPPSVSVELSASGPFGAY